MSSFNFKDRLIDLYLNVKVRKTEDLDNLTSEEMDKEKDFLENLTEEDLFNYIENSINILIEIKANEKYSEKIERDLEKEKYINKEDPNDINGLKLYEGMLVKAESDIRGHIRVSKIILNNFLF